MAKRMSVPRAALVLALVVFHVPAARCAGEALFTAQVLQARKTAAAAFARALDPIKVRNAIEMDRADQVRRWLDAGELSADARIPTSSYPEGLPIIALAASAGSPAVARLLIARGADLDAENAVKETALMLACFLNDERGVGGANDEEPDYRVHEGIAHDLVEAGAKLDLAPGHFTAVGYAGYNGHTRLIHYLLDRGALVDGGRDGALTGLMMASMTGRKETARVLLARGADPRLKNPRGRDSLELAEAYEGAELLPMLRCALSLQPGQDFMKVCGHL
ncbi:MAG: ankyrin repeat domain-containing protein [Elusimicrobia bacterium]|nr:ankyrin repeat domain-containing protein [Elusimicrobiota bacterium]